MNEDMYKRIYDKTLPEIDKLNEELNELEMKKQKNENQSNPTSDFTRCKKTILDYMSLKHPTKDQIKRLIKRIEIDKDKKNRRWKCFWECPKNKLWIYEMLNEHHNDDFKTLVMDDKDGLHSLSFASHGSKVAMYEPNEVYIKDGIIDNAITTPITSFGHPLVHGALQKATDFGITGLAMVFLISLQQELFQQSYFLLYYIFFKPRD